MNPVRSAPPIPRLNGSSATWTPAFRATAAVSSVEPSDTTRTSYSGVCSASSLSTAGSDCSSLYAGMMISVRGTSHRIPSAPVHGASAPGTGGLGGRGGPVGIGELFVVFLLDVHRPDVVVG